MLRPCYAWRLAMVSALAVLVGCCDGERDAPPRTIETEPQGDFSQHELKFAGCNVVFISLDALQAAHVGCLGHSRNTTPALDELARESCAFTNAISVSSWTVPASMSWFTGVYPTEHGVTNKFAVYNQREQKPARLRDLSPHLPTLADVLRQNGYATVAFTGNAGVSGWFGFEEGFDIYEHEPGIFGSFDYTIPRALAWLKQHRGEKFFLFLHGYDCHGQYTPPGGFDNRFVERGYDGKYTGAPQEQEMLREEGLERGELTMREADVRFWRAIYDEKIQRTDEKLSRFLAELTQLGLLENTLLVITSDHGTEFYEHRRFDHGFTLYNEQIHVPLFIKLPGQTACKVVSQRVSSIDLMPTILDLLQVSMPADAETHLRGTSLVPAIQGTKVSRDVLAETDYRAYTYKRAIIDPDGWKLIYTLETRSRELFDLKTDRDETKNLAATQSRRADELEERLFAHYRDIGHDLRSRPWEVGLNPVYDSQAKPQK